MIRIAICEDEKIILENIRKILEIASPNYDVYSFSSLLELDKSRNNFEYDIYLLDIEFENASGFDYAKSIRKVNSYSKIAFITSHDEFAIDSFSFNINGYLLKPFTKDSLLELVDRLAKELNKPKEIILVKENYIDVPVALSDIEYVQRIDRKTIINCKNDSLETNESITSLFERLSSSVFSKIDRSTLVNLGNIREIKRIGENYQLSFSSGQLTITSKQFRSLNMMLREFCK